MKKLLPILSLIVGALLPVLSLSQVEGIEYKWKKTLEKEGIEIFSSRMPNSKFRAVLTKMQVKGDIKSLVALLEDTENCSNWASLCKEMSMVKEIKPDEYFVYIQNSVLFPVADRDLVARITWHRDAKTNRLTMNSQALQDSQGVPEKAGVVRVSEARTQWHFTPQPEGYVLVETYTHIDPNGSIPAWIVNSISKKAPFRSMQKVRAIIQSGIYNNVVVKLPKKYL